MKRKKKSKQETHVCVHCGGALDKKLVCIADPTHVGIISRGLYYRYKEMIEADQVLSAYPSLREEALGPPPSEVMHLCQEPDFEGFD